MRLVTRPFSIKVRNGWLQLRTFTHTTMKRPHRDILVCGAIIASFASCGPKVEPIDEVPKADTVYPKEERSLGFKVACLDRSSVDDLLKEKPWGIRVYDARRAADDAEGTVLAVAIDGANGKELSGDAKDAHYRLHDHLEASSSVEVALDATAAKERVDRVTGAGDPLYAVELSAEVLAKLLADTKAQALEFTPVILSLPEGDAHTMMVRPVTVSGGVATPIPGGYRWVDTDPCPPPCGPPDNYLVTMR